ncbi:MAG: 3-hydroxybutyryl-CoA dehydrogenase [Actinobacteria bacterium]|jgi:3-hydroxybutyryl-CoA dehydrogenase|nr:MAG: 3-hydroxybutyryl-CoA dehydrogenase [Actinomycetota bacterium]
MEINKVLVVGAGVMGSGIVQVFAQSGYGVCMIDRSSDLIAKGMANVEKGLDKAIRKNAISVEDKQAALARVTATVDWGCASEADFVVEAVFEDMEVKKESFRRLDEVCRPEVILASNTSSLPITPMAAVTSRPDRFIGMHFFNPVPAMKLVEVIRGYLTSDETNRIVVELARKLGKTPVEVNDAPGFAMSRIFIVMINEAVYCLYEGVGTPQAVDEVMKLGAGHPMGPLEVADLLGLDIVLHIMDVLHAEFKDSKYRACPLLRKMVAAGELGRKTGRGFYSYEA